MLAILLFNWCGYRLLTAFFEEKANTELETQLNNNNYDESELISFKISAENFGYYINSKNFERVSGQVEINGIQYNYVKRRLFNDSLELLCIPNHTAIQLKAVKNNFFKLVNDLQYPGQGKKNTSHQDYSKSFSSDYYANNALFKINDQPSLKEEGSFYYSTIIISRSHNIPAQPPDHIA